MSRTPSQDSRSNHTLSAVDVNATNSPDKYYFSSSPRSPRRNFVAQFSTPSVEREFKNQLSVCSDPTVMRTLSCQSSIDPCVPEEDSPEEVVIEPIPSTSGISTKHRSKIVGTQVPSSPLVMRPDTLNLDDVKSKTQKFLYRSSSTKLTKKPRLRPKLDSALLDQIYYISQHRDDDNFDSIEVIDERRRKNFTRNNTAVVTSTDASITTNLEDVVVDVGSDSLNSNNMVNLQRNDDERSVDIRKIDEQQQTTKNCSKRNDTEIENEAEKSQDV